MTLRQVVQTTQHQGNVRYGTSRDIQSPCKSLLKVSWVLLRSPRIWDKFNLACILDKWDQSFKSIKKFRYLGIQDLSQELLVENRSINVEFLKTKTVEITIGAYLISVVNGVHQIEPGTLITVNNYILGLI